MMIVYGQGDGANPFIPAATLVSYSAPVAIVVMPDMNPIDFIYTVPEVW